MFMLRKILARSALLLTLFMLIGCQPELEPETAALPTEAALAMLAGTETRSPAATEPVATPRPTQTDLPTPATDTPVATTAPLEATATPVPIEPTATAEPWYGELDGTFYRGSPSAPVRLIDYSDFL